MNTEETKNESVRTMEGKYHEAVNVGVTHIALSVENAEAVLAYIAELEAKVPEEVDNVSNLKVGDTVKTLIDYMFTNKGSYGTVERIDQDEYPIRVRFQGERYPIGYKRFELGKVSA